MTISLILFTLSLICYNISQKQLFGQLPWRTKYYGFYGMGSFNRKYKHNGYVLNFSTYEKYPAPDNWYYKLFNIKYKEAFPLSCTALVIFTDLYHLLQFIGFKLLFISISLQLENFWTSFFIMWGIEVVTFNVGFKLIKK